MASTCQSLLRYMHHVHVNLLHLAGSSSRHLTTNGALSVDVAHIDGQYGSVLTDTSLGILLFIVDLPTQ
jgi:hypothetical protein